MSRAAEIVRKGLEAQAEVEHYGEGTVTITGPVDLEELAQYLNDKIVEGFKSKGRITVEVFDEFFTVEAG